jgi:hypothetical protein
LATSSICVPIGGGAARARRRRGTSRVAGADAVGHQRVDVQADELVGGVAEQRGGHRGWPSRCAALVDEQQRIGIGREERAKDGALVDAGGQRRGGGGMTRRQPP